MECLMESVNGYRKSHKWIKVICQLTGGFGREWKEYFHELQNGKKEMFFQCIRPSGNYQAKT